MLGNLFERRNGLAAHTVLFVVGFGYQAVLQTRLYLSGEYIRETFPFEILARLAAMWSLLWLFHLATVQLYRAFDVDWRRFPYHNRHRLRDFHVGLYMGVSSYLWSLVLAVALTGGTLTTGTATARVLVITAVWGMVMILQQFVVFELDRRSASP